MPITGPEADGHWTPRRIVADADLASNLRCACGIRAFDMWRIHSRQRDDNLEHMPFKCRVCGQRAQSLEVQRFMGARFQLAASIVYISYDDKHRPGLSRPNG